MTDATSPTARPPETPHADAVCPNCSTPRGDTAVFCGECGFVFPAGGPAAGTPLRDRYETTTLLGECQGVFRFRGLDRSPGGGRSVPVTILRAAPTPLAEAVDAEDVVQITDTPSDSGNSSATLRIIPWQSAWPGLDWEEGLLRRLTHSAVPRVLERFTVDTHEYLVEEALDGRPLWEAWDAPETTTRQRFGWLIEIAELLRALHHVGAMVDAVAPDLFAVAPAGVVVLTDPGQILPLPPPHGAGPRGSLYSAPEWLQRRDAVDARADLYGFGALVYALHLGRDLSDRDFDALGHPEPFVSRFPDAHPLFARLIGKTFCFHPDGRFPTDDGWAEDPTGFAEVLQLLRQCQETLDLVRLETAAWTTVGMVRSGNEDAFALVHCQDSYQDRVHDRALVVLADGMGGTAGGEIAAALAVRSLRESLLAKPPFAGPEGPTDPDAYRELLRDALREANRLVFQTARDTPECRGMGCTADAVFLDGRQLVVGHVGDSRTYHLHRGKLRQVTRDQTLVSKLVEMGHLTEEEAEHHPRRSELQQAIGGRADVDPDFYAAPLEAGDMVVVCSDGLSGALRREQIQEVLLQCTSAEQAARRLVNLANHVRASDNVTVAVVRAC